ncbi:MAG TPA: hypothetical protein VFK32_08400 [Tepidiformaceae bacterium]|nr:hypothetical protein [Tepidiformaceae bacterium]
MERAQWMQAVVAAVVVAGGGAIALAATGGDDASAPVPTVNPTLEALMRDPTRAYLLAEGTPRVIIDGGLSYVFVEDYGSEEEALAAVQATTMHPIVLPSELPDDLELAGVLTRAPYVPGTGPTPTRSELYGWTLSYGRPEWRGGRGWDYEGPVVVIERSVGAEVKQDLEDPTLLLKDGDREIWDMGTADSGTVNGTQRLYLWTGRTGYFLFASGEDQPSQDELVKMLESMAE